MRHYILTTLLLIGCGETASQPINSTPKAVLHSGGDLFTWFHYPQQQREACVEFNNPIYIYLVKEVGSTEYQLPSCNRIMTGGGDYEVPGDCITMMLESLGTQLGGRTSDLIMFTSHNTVYLRCGVLHGILPHTLPGGPIVEVLDWNLIYTMDFKNEGDRAAIIYFVKQLGYDWLLP